MKVLKRGDIVRVVTFPRSFVPGSQWAGKDVTVDSIPGVSGVVGVFRGDVHWSHTGARAYDRAHAYTDDLVPTGEVNEEFLAARFVVKILLPDPPFRDAEEFRGPFDTPEDAWTWIEGSWGQRPPGCVMQVVKMWQPETP